MRVRASAHTGGVADGVILVDKPVGKTSHDVVAAVRRALPGRPRVGHSGTLDPFATGLVLILVGRATRAQRFFMALPKTYRALARLGAVSTTGDPEGEITQTGVMPPEPLELPVGLLRQRPPAHSAVKVGGQRAYRLARRGEAVETPEREVCVHRFELVARERDSAEFEIECSSGTYVRSLIADLGDAYCTELRRIAVGPFPVGDADPARLVPLADALGFLPERRLADEDARRASHGVAVPGEADGAVRLTDAQGLIAIAEPTRGGGASAGALKPVVGLRRR
jgi:tRNA pseudouridine55 synthase